MTGQGKYAYYYDYNYVSMGVVCVCVSMGVVCACVSMGVVCAFMYGCGSVNLLEILNSNIS